MDFFGELVKEAGNVQVAAGKETGDVTAYIDTGSYMLNAMLSGSIYKGLPSNKITAFAGEEATGKTWFVLGIAKKFLDDNKKGGVFYFESESAVSTEMIVNRGVDEKRFKRLPVTTIQEFRTQALKILNKYLETPEEDRIPIMFCLDSLGMLSTSKEISDSSEGLETRDMTKAQLVKGTFRVLTLALGRAGVPMLVTNHVYANIGGGLYAGNEISGGSGLKYAASSIIMLSKRKEKDGTEVIGNIIHCKNTKSRLTVENKMVDTLLSYSSGLSRYYGLNTLAEKHGIFKKVGNRFELPDGTKVFEKQLNSEPEKFYTKEVLDLIDAAAKKEYLYGSDQEVIQVKEIKEKKSKKD